MIDARLLLSEENEAASLSEVSEEVCGFGPLREKNIRFESLRLYVKTANF